MPAIPETLDDPLKWADWLEIYALEDKDRSSSIGDLERVLNQNSLDKRKCETYCAAVGTELGSRFKGAADGYPFTFSGSLLKQKDDLAKHTPYIFCLFLSYFDGAKKPHKGIYPDRIFEHVSRIAAQSYLNGQAVRFGWPRDASELPVQFTKAVEIICGHLGEVNYNGKKAARAKDDELDVVVWKHFPDRRSGKIILWGQCAAGWDWESKLSFNPNVFRKRWVQPDFSNPLLKSIFIPHVVDPNRWDYFAAEAEILFDRCRIASCSYGHCDVETHATSMKDWCAWILKENSE
jgi:hypothetical protein